MQKTKRWFWTLLIILTAGLGLLFGTAVTLQAANRVAYASQEAAEIQISRKTLLLGVGETYQLSASVSGNDSITKWQSTNQEVLTVKDGLVMAQAPGEAAVKVRSAGGLLAICRITVRPAPKKAVLSASELLLGVGEKYQFTCGIPTGTAACVRTYSTGNKNIVACTATGMIEAKKPGTATITMKLFNGVTAQCTVTVKKAPDSAALNAKELLIGVGETFSFHCQLPAGTAARVRTYSVSNKNILQLDGGTITAKKAGTATVTVKLYNGVTAQCPVTVKKAPTSAALSVQQLTLGVGESYRFYCTVPTGTAARVRTYSVSNKNILQLDGSTITAKKTGTATVTVKLYNGVTAQCEVTVKKAPDSVSLSTKQLTVGVGESYRFTNSIPSGTAANSRVYSVSDANVLQLSGNTVTGQKAGTATVTVKLYNGVTAKCQVTVKNAPTSVSLNYSELWLGEGETAQLKAILPSGTASYHVTYTAADKSILSCDSTGHIKALSQGTTTVSVRLYNNKRATCRVTVAPPPQYIGVEDDLAVLDIGETFRIVPTTETGAAYGGVTYTSGDKNVATADTSGLVRAVGAGTTDITVKTYNGRTVKVAVIVYGTKSVSDFPNATETDQYLNQAVLHPMKTNCEPLDSLVSSILSRVTTSNMTTAQKVRAVYDYLSQNSTYGYGYIPVNLPGSYNHYSDYWIVTSAYPLLKNHVGTCENFSAALTVLLRRIGLEANCVEGLTGMSAGGKGGHYWTDVVINGKHRVFDAQIENNNLGYDGTVYHYWYGMRPESNYLSYEYQALIPVIDFTYTA